MQRRIIRKYTYIVISIMHVCRVLYTRVISTRVFLFDIRKVYFGARDSSARNKRDIVVNYPNEAERNNILICARILRRVRARSQRYSFSSARD